MDVPVPDPDCGLCPRLAAFRAANAARFPLWHNAPVPAFGPLDAKLLVVGLAPGLRGANRSGRPFTGDHAGRLLYATLLELGLARGRYSGEADHEIALIGCRITNAVRCVPPENRPLRDEFRACARFLDAEIAAMPRLRGIVALGALAHAAVLATLKLKPSDHPFGHGRIHAGAPGPVLAASYHCSRQNTNTGRLTPAMFAAVFADMKARCGL